MSGQVRTCSTLNLMRLTEVMRGHEIRNVGPFVNWIARIHVGMLSIVGGLEHVRGRPGL